MNTLQKIIHRLSFILVLIAIFVANDQLGDHMISYREFNYFSVAVFFALLLAITFDILARKIYQRKKEYALFWLGRVIMLAVVIYMPTLFTLPQIWVRVLLVALYLLCLLIIEELYFSKKGIFREKK